MVWLLNHHLTRMVLKVEHSNNNLDPLLVNLQIIGYLPQVLLIVNLTTIDINSTEKLLQQNREKLKFIKQINELRSKIQILSLSV